MRPQGLADSTVTEDGLMLAETNSLGSESMNQHRYDIVTEDGDIVLSIISGFTNLDFDAYAQRHVVPLLASVSAVEGERVFYTAA